MSLVDPEDRKLATLARATRLRAKAAEGAAIRDTDGRTYAAATVNLPSLQISAVQAAVAMAVAAGVRGLEAAVIHTGATEVSAQDAQALAEFNGAPVATHVVAS